jgi:hypothetical protein
MKAYLLTGVMACFLTGCYPPMIGRKPIAKEGSIRKTEANIERRVVFSGEPLQKINAITTVSNQGKAMIVVGGRDGAAFLTRDYVQERFVPFSPTSPWMATTVAIDVDGDGRYEFMDRGGGWSPVKLVSNEGQMLWSFPDDYKRSRLAADQMAAGDLDADGHLDFVVGMNAGGGVYALARDGSVKWRHQAHSVNSVEIVDLNGDGKLEIVHIDGRDVVIRDSKGTEIRRFEFPAYTFHPLIWKLHPEGIFIVGSKNSFIHLFNPLGNKISTVRLPHGEGYPGAIQPVRFGGTLFYAAATRVSYAYKIGYLYIFSESGQVLHEEIFTERVEALAAIPDPLRAGSEILLIGVGTQMIEYQRK